MSLQLDIINASNSNDKITLKIGGTDTTVEFSVSNVTHKVTLVDLNFSKQMYQPGKIVARLQITDKDGNATQGQNDDKSYTLLKKADLITQFKTGKTITLSDSDASDNPIATGYKVYDVIPHYKTDSLYADLIIYSPDYDLTTTIESKTYVAKQLGEEILKSKFTNSEIKLRNQLKCTNETYNSSSSKTETTDDEYIHPYLVQYNESFWDFLTRTANRWGEFVYYEDDKLILGRKQFTDSNDNDDIKEIASYTSLSYENVSADKTLLANCRKTVTTDDYLRLIKKGKYLRHAGDIGTGDSVYLHKLFQHLFAIKGTVWEFLADFLIGDFVTEWGNNEKYLKTLKDRYNDQFFTVPNKAKATNSPNNKFGELLTRVAKHFNSGKTEGRQFAYYDTKVDSNNNTVADEGGLTVANYKIVRDNELKAGKNVLCINLGTSYQDLRLGDVFTFRNNVETIDNNNYTPKYLVIGVECKSNGSSSAWEAHYYIRAIRQNNVLTDANATFYPPMLPTGHIRFSGPQRGTVAAMYDGQKMDDPLRSGRYRVRNTWQSSTETASPWLRVSHEMMSRECGAVWQLEEGTEVLLDFEDGNVELPYLVGALQTTGASSVSRNALFNDMDFCTPAGHAIRQTDGTGDGAAAFLASFSPMASWIKKLYPEATWDKGKGQADSYKDERAYEEKHPASKFYAGGVELTDKFGIYKIKASTDERNISIKSPYGDITINAFTGITVSAPNGDVKIEGKNVNIEAGNTITLESGKNIAKGILGSIAFGAGHNDNNVDVDADDRAKAAFSSLEQSIANKIAGQIDIPFVRHVVETFLRPVNGSMKLYSNKYMILESGINVKAASEKQWKEMYMPWVRNNNIVQMVCNFIDNRGSAETPEVSAWGGCDYKNGDIVFKRQSNATAEQLDTGGYTRRVLRANAPSSQKGNVRDTLDATHEGFI